MTSSDKDDLHYENPNNSNDGRLTVDPYPDVDEKDLYWENKEETIIIDEYPTNNWDSDD